MLMASTDRFTLQMGGLPHASFARGCARTNTAPKSARRAAVDVELNMV
jgi:hypothetical protein